MEIPYNHKRSLHNHANNRCSLSETFTIQNGDCRYEHFDESLRYNILFGDFVCVSADVLCHIKVVVVSSVVGGIQSDMIEGFLTRCLFHQCHPANSDRRVPKKSADKMKGSYEEHQSFR